MLRTDRILVATDFSGSAERARRQAEHLAAVHDAALHVLHVTRDPELAALFAGATEDVTSRRAQVYLSEWLGHSIAPPSTRDGEDDGRAVTWTVRKGKAPAETILQYSEDVGADVIVMGAASGAKVFRSVADRVVRRATCPVITIPNVDEGDEDAGSPDPPHPSLDHILVPVEFSAPAASLVKHAQAVAANNGASVDLVHVLEGSSWKGDSRRGRHDAPPETAVQARAALHSLVEETSSRRVSIRARVLTGEPASTLVQYATTQPIDLILMGTRGRSGLRRLLLGSVVEEVIRRAPCPVGTLKGESTGLLPVEERRAPKPSAATEPQNEESPHCFAPVLT